MVLSGPEKEETRAAAAYLSATTGRALLGFDLEYEALCSFAWWANRVHPPYNSKRPSSVGVEVLEISRAGGGEGWAHTAEVVRGCVHAIHEERQQQEQPLSRRHRSKGNFCFWLRTSRDNRLTPHPRYAPPPTHNTAASEADEEAFSTR
jgi:hypothetical protein